MIFSVKIFAVFMPILAAVFYGVGYVLYGRVLQTVNVQTLVVASTCWSVFSGLAVYFLFPSKINFAPFVNASVLTVAVSSFLCTFLGWVCTLWAVQKISPTYAAIGEISYPLFTALFAYLIFHDRQLDWKMAAGGLLIAAGSYIIISDKIKIGG